MSPTLLKWRRWTCFIDTEGSHRAHPPTGSHMISVPFPPQKEPSEPLVAKVMNSNSLSPIHKGLHAELTASVGRCQESHLAFPTATHLSHCQGTLAARLPCGRSSLCICMKGRDTPAPPCPAPPGNWYDHSNLQYLFNSQDFSKQVTAP